MESGFRENTVRLLEALRDLSPVVGPVELCCSWFDDLYFPGHGAWENSFSQAEKAALAEFNSFFSEVAPALSESGSEFRQDPNWKAVGAKAKEALESFNRPAA